MKRILIPLVIAAGCLGQPGFAETNQEMIISELREQGFTRIEISRTLLGRTRILAESEDYEREIVLNPATGVILRDFWKKANGGGGGGTLSLVGDPETDGGSRSTSDNSGRGSSDSDGDDSDDDGGDDSDDDSSSGGSGGSDGGSGDDDSSDDGDDSDDNSGSGSDDSGSDSDDDDDDDDGDD